MLRPERQHDGVVARGRLQLEVEGPAEALAQREPEAAVDPRAEGRVHDELHAAGVVEEALDDEALRRRQRAELGAGRPRGRRRPARPTAGRPRRSSCDSARSARVGPPARPSASSTSCRRLRDRLGQLGGARRAPRRARTGRVGAAPSASTTRTVPCSTRRIRQDVLPSRKTSPAIASMAKSSLTVPTSVSSGSSDDAVVGEVGDRAARGRPP